MSRNIAKQKRAKTTFHPDYPLDSQLGEVNTKLTFHVSLSRQDLKSKLHHRWLFNGCPIIPVIAKALRLTVSGPDLIIEKAKELHCGYYCYQNETVPVRPGDIIKRKVSETAELQMFSNCSIVLSCLPKAGSSGGGTACPGPYIGFADYNNSNDPSGGWYFPNGGQAFDPADPNHTCTDTVVYHQGVPFTNRGCNTATNDIPASVYPYHFTIYFKKTVPPVAYPLKLLIT